MSEAVLIYPNQLFDRHPAVLRDRKLFLIEDPLFFNQYPFHAKKLLFHRASMKAYEKEQSKRFKTFYVEHSQLKRSEDIFEVLRKHEISRAFVAAPNDNYLERSLKRGSVKSEISIYTTETPAFLTPLDWAESFFERHNNYYFTKFYVEQRKRLGILFDKSGKPEGGKWTYDTENRKKLPKGYLVPRLTCAPESDLVRESTRQIRKEFPTAPGSIDSLEYPTTRKASLMWLKEFLEQRFKLFGDYEDAIDAEEPFLHHSVLTPMLNAGLLTPAEIVEHALEAGKEFKVQLNSLEGFIRQVVGWREYMRLIYLREGTQQRNLNFWGHSRKIPDTFWTGQTGIEPVDVVIKRTLRHAYAHHIERLMILGNFMLLCEFNPKEVYQWFMALFIDAYDWVMVPNVYGMSQFADGGLITTKPYLSSSNYVRKMSNFSKGPWCELWDSLYWDFINRHQDFFSTNPRLKMMTSHLGRMGAQKVSDHRSRATEFKKALSAI